MMLMARFFFIAVIFATACFGQLKAPPTKESLQAYHRAIVGASPTKSHKLAEEVFHSRFYDNHVLNNLTTHPNLSVASQASWTLKAQELCQRWRLDDFREARVALINRFVGQLEGRLHISSPKFWVDSLCSMNFNSDASGLSMYSDQPPETSWGLTDLSSLRNLDREDFQGTCWDMSISSAVSASQFVSEVTPKDNDTPIQLPLSIAASSRIRSLKVGEESVIASYDFDRNSEYRLFFINRNGVGRTRQRNTPSILVANQPQAHFILLDYDRQSHRIFVWGVCFASHYLDVYDLEGELLHSFSTF